MSRFNTSQTSRPPAGAAPGPAQPYFEEPHSPNTQPAQRTQPRSAAAPMAPPGYGHQPQFAPAGQPTAAQDLYAQQVQQLDAYRYAQPQQVAPPFGHAVPQQPDPYAHPYYPQQPQPSYPQQPQPSQRGYGYGAQLDQPAPPNPAPNGYAMPRKLPDWHDGFNSGVTPGHHSQQPQTNFGSGYAESFETHQAAEAWTQPAGGRGYDGGQEYWAQPGNFGQHGAEPAFDDQDPALGPPPSMYGAAPHQPQPGSFDQSYAEDDVEYEEEPAKRSWTKIAAVISAFVVMGGAATYGYNALVAPRPSGGTPVVRGDEAPVKVKPSDPGGKQFAHSDSKIMDRLGEAGAQASEPSPGAEGTSSSVDANGVRKVPVLVVGRDGTIQAPQPVAPAEPQTRATVVVPGLTVIDGLGGGRPAPAPIVSAPPPQKTVTASEPEKPVVVTPPAAKKPQIIATAEPQTQTQTEDAAPQPVKKPAAPTKKPAVVATAPAAPAATGSTTTNGYVVVLASVPASASSRIDALKQFADMQQKYSALLQDKLPDVREADLGEKGTYHRLLAGPPGSKESANQVCSQLKAQGYPSCWVTAY